MRRFFITISLAFVSLVTPVAAQSRDAVFLLGEGDMTTTQRWEAPRKQYEALPKWAPSSGLPPLSISKALELGTGWIGKRYPEVKLFEPSSISLVRAGCCVTGDERWFYRLQFEPVVAGQRMFGGRFVAVVLLDGTVVEPRAEKTQAR